MILLEPWTTDDLEKRSRNQTQIFNPFYRRQRSRFDKLKVPSRSREKPFVRLRRELLTNAMLEIRLTKIEKELLSHDAALRSLYTKIKPLLLPPPETPAKEMGFHTGPKKP